MSIESFLQSVIGAQSKGPWDQVMDFVGLQPSTNSQFSEGVGQLFDGTSKIYAVAKEQSLKLLAQTPLENLALTVNTYVKTNADILFFAIALYNLYQQALFFLVGAGCGFMISQTMKNFGLSGRSVELITNRQDKAESVYLQAIIWLSAQPWVSAFASGFVVGNYLGTPEHKGFKIPFTNITILNHS